jgi:WbqC-like protein family
MKLGIMQPYFFPYLGYFDLIHRTDRFLLFDTAQYIRHGWVNRNRILHPRQSWKYIIVPLRKHHRETPIADIEVAPGTSWKEEILGQLDHYRKRAPYFREVSAMVTSIFGMAETRLARLNGLALHKVCAYLEIPFQIEFVTEMNLTLPNVSAPGDWALEISQAVGAATYLNPIGGREIFETDRFHQAGIGLEFVETDLIPYATPGYTFEAGLSILDVMMWNSPEAIRDLLRGSCVLGQE